MLLPKPKAAHHDPSHTTDNAALYCDQQAAAVLTSGLSLSISALRAVANVTQQR